MYISDMRRIQIYIQEDLDDRLQAESARRMRSKASLIRECVVARYGEELRIDKDSLTGMIGAVDIDPENIDDEVYG